MPPASPTLRALADLMPEGQLWEGWQRDWEIRRTVVSLAQIAAVVTCLAFKDDPEGWLRQRIADSHTEKGMH